MHPKILLINIVVMSVLEALVIVGLVALLLFEYRITTWVLFYMLWGYLFRDINPKETYSWYPGIWHGESFFTYAPGVKNRFFYLPLYH